MKKRQRYRRPCGHYAPDVNVKRIVRFRPGFDAQLIHCRKCGDYYTPFNAELLPEQLQEELALYGFVSADDIHRFLE